MINKIVHFSDLHLRLFKDHDIYKQILTDAFDQWKELGPDRIVFTGDLVHSKNQVTPELIEMVVWILTECSKICKTIVIPGNHDALINNLNRLDTLSPIKGSTVTAISHVGLAAGLLANKFVCNNMISLRY